MARKNIQRGSEEFEMFTDFWNLYKDHAIVEDNDEYMDHVISAAEKFHKKYKTEFAKDLAVAVLNEIDRRCRNEV